RHREPHERVGPAADRFVQQPEQRDPVVRLADGPRRQGQAVQLQRSRGIGSGIMLNRLRRSTDEGFGLMEVVVAMSIFGVMAAAALALIVRSLDVTRGNSQRVAASN